MPKSLSRVFFLVVIMGLLICLGGCAAKKLMVRNADTLLEYQLEKRLHLYSDQKRVLSEDIKQFLKQNRTEAQELFPIIDELSLDEEKKLEKEYKYLTKVYDKVALGFSGIIAKHMAVLDSKQQKDFFETLAEENRQLARNDPDEKIQKFQDRFKTFFGSVDKNQKQMITNFKDEIVSSNKAKLDRREKLHKEFKQIFLTGASPASKKEAFLDAFKKYQLTAHNHERNLKIIKEIIPGLSPPQKEFFRKRTLEVKEVLKLYLDTDY